MNDGIIKYQIANTKYILNLNKKITLTRNNDEINHTIIFDDNKNTKSEYYIKNFNSSLEFTISTIEINQSKNNIYIKYKVIETENIFEYRIEMSEN